MESSNKELIKLSRSHLSYCRYNKNPNRRKRNSLDVISPKQFRFPSANFLSQSLSCPFCWASPPDLGTTCKIPVDIRSDSGITLTLVIASFIGTFFLGKYTIKSISNSILGVRTFNNSFCSWMVNQFIEPSIYKHDGKT